MTSVIMPLLLRSAPSRSMAMSLWRRERQPGARGERGLGGIADGALAFDGLLTLLTGRDLAELDLRCPNCPGLSLEEARLIAVLAALQRGEEDLARALAGLWLPPALARLAMNPAGRLARALLAAGLPLQGCGLSQRVSAGRQGGDRGLTLVH